MAQLDAFLDQTIKILSQRKEIVFALLYGSALDSFDFRDIDLGIYIDRGLFSPATDFDYAQELSDLLSRMIHFPADVHVINDAPPGFRYNVSKGKALLVNNFETLAHFRERAWDEWFDFEPVARLYLKDI